MSQPYAVKYHRDTNIITLEIVADAMTINEIVTKFNPMVTDILRRTMSDGKDRAAGKEVKKPCGCGG